MAIIGQYPDQGMRLVVERPREGGPPWRYEGEAVFESRRVPVAAVLDAAGTVAVEASPEAPADLAERVRLIVRAAWKHAQPEGLEPPRRISRWRPER
ncbi:MAG TPA: hypothetical protein VGM06_01910 [Polyangiaceae bacterium]|jgi:hypothetical protein